MTNFFNLATWIMQLTPIQEQQAIEAAKMILEEPLVDYKALLVIEGIGERKAKTIFVGTQYPGIQKQSTKQIKCSRDIADAFASKLTSLPYEEFHVAYLSRTNKIIKTVKISQGGVSGTVTDIRIILKHGINCLSSAMILAHNHPSGNLNPSQADKKITNKITEAAKYMDISVLDHVIIGTDGTFFSFADQGMI